MDPAEIVELGTSSGQDRARTTAELLALEAVSGDHVGHCLEGSLGRAFGGHVLAQCLWAHGLDTGFRAPVNSMHAYFVASGRPGEPVRYATQRLNVGRTVSRAAVRAAQGPRLLLEMMVSTHAGERGASFQDPAPAVEPPERLPVSATGRPGVNPLVWAPFELRYASHDHRPDDRFVWVKSRHSVEDGNPDRHAALLSYVIDFVITESVRSRLPVGADVVGASLDQSAWFHRPFDCGDWLLVHVSSDVLAGGRALSKARVFDLSRRRVASAVQETLYRPGRMSAGLPFPAGE